MQIHLRKYVGNKLPIFQFDPISQRNFPLIFFMSDWKISVKEETKFCRYFWTDFDLFFWLGLHGMEMIK